MVAYNNEQEDDYPGGWRDKFRHKDKSSCKEWEAWWRDEDGSKTGKVEEGCERQERQELETAGKKNTSGEEWHADR